MQDRMPLNGRAQPRMDAFSSMDLGVDKNLKPQNPQKPHTADESARTGPKAEGRVSQETSGLGQGR